MTAASVIDWSKHKEPWRSIGLAFRAECEAIAASRPPLPPPPRPGPPRGRPFRKAAEVPQEGT